jgi:hypothetical protein
MKGWIGPGLAAAMVLGPGAASADDTSGHVALALASLVGLNSPSLTATQKSVLTAYLAGNSAANPRAKITITAAKVSCGAGDVDITRFFCELTFGTATKELTARAAHELYATLAEAGVQSDGAAGTIYEGVTDLKCVLTPADISQNGGGGAACTFTPGE